MCFPVEKHLKNIDAYHNLAINQKSSVLKQLQSKSEFSHACYTDDARGKGFFPPVFGSWGHAAIQLLIAVEPKTW